MGTETTSIIIYGNDSCAYCGAARMLLTKKGASFENALVNNDSDKLAEMHARSGRTSVPQIFVGDAYIGGFDELCELDMSGELDQLLAAE
jgi:glutaredoxin 3